MARIRLSNLSANFQGSTETTFYVLAVYFGSVKISKTRYAAVAGLFCDLVGMIAAILLAYLFYDQV
jgi:spore maturation protein SpmB